MDSADWIATYAAGLSTLLALRELRRSNRRLKITSCPAFNGMAFKPSGNFTRVTVANDGAHTVYVRSLFLSVHLRRYRITETVLHLYRYWRWQRGSWVGQALPESTVIEPPLPSEILPGRSLTVWLPAAPFMEISKGRRVRLIIQDELDRSIYSPDLTLHLSI